jgi:hypothetical protein
MLKQNGEETKLKNTSRPKTGKRRGNGTLKIMEQLWLQSSSIRLSLITN